ncbi:unnamed protein product [Sphenostylis stenocarpa]|uniref:Uncharacterized protein n=1 Tax=Sphenostylis stenocarpa TaxID=92480 RepID=A0AA86SQM7_9FABA|nr:unnamed protein product [Sphenostylis stenocarpa]
MQNYATKHWFIPLLQHLLVIDKGNRENSSVEKLSIYVAQEKSMEPSKLQVM